MSESDKSGKQELTAKVKNKIPPMTHELSRAWDQPASVNFLIDDTHAVCRRKHFEHLRDYSYSRPSGVYEGKMWRAQYTDKGGVVTDYLYWWDFSNNPNACSCEMRILLIIDQKP